MADDIDGTTTPRQRRRRYDKAFKEAIVDKTLAPGASVARIAREHDINANQLFKWRRQYLTEGRARSANSPAALVPVTVLSEGLDNSAPPSSEPGSAAGLIEILFAGGTVRIQGVVEPQALQLVLSSLRR
jgi:transposase